MGCSFCHCQIQPGVKALGWEVRDHREDSWELWGQRLLQIHEVPFSSFYHRHYRLVVLGDKFSTKKLFIHLVWQTQVRLSRMLCREWSCVHRGMLSIWLGCPTSYVIYSFTIRQMTICRASNDDTGNVRSGNVRSLLWTPPTKGLPHPNAPTGFRLTAWSKATELITMKFFRLYL